MPERKPQATIKPPIGANSANTDFKFKPIFVSIIAAMKIVHVEKIADINNGINDILVSTKITEYIKNGIGMNSMNKTAKKTPTAYDLF
tara:strand:- start:9 stop:272 length:264 start_codon:yes stop_codon:yes gene_type:complete